MKLVIKHRGLCSMSFIICIIFLCICVSGLCACRTNINGNVSEESVSEVLKEDNSGNESESSGNIQASVMGRGYNPQMDFVYDEHDDVDVDEDYVNTLCGEAGRQLEEMFGPAEFYVAAVHNEDESYTINVMYNEKAVSFSDEELQQINMYINQEYKEVRLSEINIQGW